MRRLKLYEDDTDFTYRLTMAGYVIVLSPESIVTDLEANWTSGVEGSAHDAS